MVHSGGPEERTSVVCGCRQGLFIPGQVARYWRMRRVFRGDIDIGTLLSKGAEDRSSEQTQTAAGY